MAVHNALVNEQKNPSTVVPSFYKLPLQCQIFIFTESASASVISNLSKASSLSDRYFHSKDCQGAPLHFSGLRQPN